MTDNETLATTGDRTPTKPDSVGMSLAPTLEAQTNPALKESGCARATRLRTAGNVAVATTRVNHANDDEPHEDIGFGD